MSKIKMSKIKTISGPKIIVFSRTSTTQQDVEQQTKVLQDEATRMGYPVNCQIVVEYQESATKLDIETRKGINALKETITNNHDVDTVICWELTRIARRADVIYNIRDFLIAHKIRWIVLKPSMMELIDRQGQVTPTMSMMLAIFTSFAESEMIIKKERFKRAKNEMRERGQKFGGSVIFGYMKDENKKCVPDPLKSEIVIDLFNHYANCDSSLHECYVYASSKWPNLFPIVEYVKAQHKMRYYLTQEIYWKGNWCYPPIVMEETAMKVLEKMKNARCVARYQCKRELLCRGKIYCKHCGRMMIGSGGNTKAYICTTDKLHSLQINWDIADWIIWEETRSVVNNNSAFSFSNKIEETKQIIEQKSNLQKQYKKSLEIIKEKFEKLLDLYLNNKINIEIYNKREMSLKDDENKLTKTLQKIEAEILSYRNILEETQKDILNPKSINIDSITDFKTRQEFVRKYINKMMVERCDEGLHITFEYAMPVITARSVYLYVYKNQSNSRVYRMNEDGTIDLVYNHIKINKRNKKTGRFE